MDIEIIQTDNPNIVIERTISEKEIDLAQTQLLINSFNNLIQELNEQKVILEQQNNTIPEVQVLINEKISNIIGEIFSYQEQVNKLSIVVE